MSRRRQVLRLGWGRADRLGLTALLAVWAAALGASWAGRPARPVADAALTESVRETIDPNAASAASLRRLPGIGPALAGAIVEYRQAFARRPVGRRAFETADDLQNVPGIGPRTVRRMQPFLAIAAVPASGTAPAAGGG